MKQKLNERLYKTHFVCAKQWRSVWNLKVYCAVCSIKYYMLCLAVKCAGNVNGLKLHMQYSYEEKKPKSFFRVSKSYLNPVYIYMINS